VNIYHGIAALLACQNPVKRTDRLYAHRAQRQLDAGEPRQRCVHYLIIVEDYNGYIIGHRQTLIPETFDGRASDR